MGKHSAPAKPPVYAMTIVPKPAPRHSTGCKHYYREVGLLSDGCKMVGCEHCPDKAPMHFKVYGCKNPEAV